MKIILILFLFIIIIPTIVLADLGRLPGFLAVIYAFPEGDKLGHFGLYGILAFLIVAVVPVASEQKPWRNAFLSCFILVAFIGIEEVSQILLANRSADPVDFICSVLGVGVFGYAAWLVKRKKVSSQP
jgi:polysaccharide biosynthesis protein VpsQ